MEIKCQKYLQVLHFSFSPHWKISVSSRCVHAGQLLLTLSTVHRLSCCSASAGVEPSRWATRSMPTTCTTRPSTSSNTSWSSPPLRMPRKTRTWGERQRYILSKANTSDFRLVVMSLRAQSLLNLRLYKMKRHELKDYERTIQDVLAKSGEEEVWRNWILRLYEFALLRLYVCKPTFP